MLTLSMETFEQSSFDMPKLDITEKVEALNSSFISRVTAENGFFGKIDNLTKIDLINTEFSKVLDFINHPEHILGSDLTKHGEIAERLEVAIRNADDIANGKIPTATADLHRTGPVDIMIDGNPIQMKFYNGTRNTLSAVIESLNKGGEYTNNTFFIPKDQYAIMEQISNHFKANGNLASLQIESNGSRLRGSTLENMLGKIKEIESKTGKNFDDVIRPASTDYKEVQLGVAKETLQTKQIEALKTVEANILQTGYKSGIQSGLTAAGLTFAISTVDNVRDFIAGEISVQEAFIDVAADTGIAGALGFAEEFISTSVAQAMQGSGSGKTLLNSLGKSHVPAAVISFGIDSYDSVIDYARGNISGKQLAIDLGESAVGVAGSIGGAALAGAAVGSVAGPVGFAAGLVGGMVGYAVSTGAYATAIEVAQGGIEVLADKVVAVADTTVETYTVVSELAGEGAQVVATTAVSIADFTVDTYEAASTAIVENAEVLKTKAIEMGQDVINMVAKEAPEALDSVKTAMNNFATSLGLSLSL